MANQQTKSFGKKAQTHSSNPLIPEKYQDTAYIIALFLSVILFLSPALFTGGSFNASDNIASFSFDTYLKNASKAGEFPQWIPYIFGGMPSYSALLTTGDRSWDFLSSLYFGISKFMGIVFNNDIARIAFHYIMYAIGMYALMRSKGKDRFIAFCTGFAAVFSTFIITWIMIGHNTKPIALATFPFILLFLEKLRHKFSLGYASALVLAVHVLVESTHVQMAYYGIITFGLYLIAIGISSIIKKESLLGIIRSSVALLIAGILAFGMSADRYLSVLEYKSSSTRGSGPIQQSKAKAQDNTGGFDYDYCTNWSFSPEETITFLIPNYFGFGKLEYKPNKNTKGQIVQSYWGQMPFTDAANYMGIGVLALALIGIIAFRKDIFIHYLIALSLISLFLSFGKNFPLLFDFFYYYMPGFNNFRAPMMALCVMQFAIPILFGYGISALTSWRENRHPDQDKILYSLAGALGLLLVSSIFIEEGSYSEAIAQTQKIPQELFPFIYSSMKSDWFLTSFIGIITVAISLLYVKGILKKGIFYTVFAIILIVDLWRVAGRPMEVNKGDVFKNEFTIPDFVNFIKQDKSLYRIADYVYLTQGKTNVPAYFELQNVHGYHSAKMRLYQDVLDIAGGAGGNAITNPFLLNLLNVKYMAAPQPLFEGIKPIYESTMQTSQGLMPTLVYDNPGVLPRAFFVDSVVVASDMSVLNHLKNGDFDPRKIAYVQNSLSSKIDNALNAKARILSFQNERIDIQTENSGNNFLFISELYYPVSWKCYIDDKETETIQTNYAFRGIIVPAGKHKVSFIYRGQRFEQGKMISLIVNILTTLSFVIAFFLERRKSNS
jgi:hypothetical protein